MTASSRGTPPPTEVAIIAPRDGNVHAACAVCGFVTIIPSDRTDPLPWCVHGSSYSWGDPHPATQAGKWPWTRMVRVRVEADCSLSSAATGAAFRAIEDAIQAPTHQCSRIFSFAANPALEPMSQWQTRAVLFALAAAQQ
jgi:hypothetical protein